MITAVHTRLPPGSDDTGETLIELIIAMAIMGVTVVAIVGGIATTILMSDVHRKQATAGSYVRSYAEAVGTYAADPKNFDRTSSPIALQKGVDFAVPSGFTATVTSPVRCWDGKAFGSCEKTKTSTVQQVTLNVASTDSRASESLVVVVRKP